MAPFLIIALVAVVVIVLGVLSWQAEKRRREALAAFAARHGFHFSPDKDRSLASRFGFIDKLAGGTNRYAFNVFTGSWRSREVVFFDYHYETHSTDSKGRRRTHHHYLWCAVLLLPKSFPELVIGPEGFLSKVAQFFGYDDIDFESHAFSRAYCVRCKSKKFAYDVCNARLIEYLLERPGTSLEIEGQALSTAQSGRLSPESIPAALDLLADVRERLPDYLFEAP